MLPFHGQCDLDQSGPSEACYEMQANDEILESLIDKSSRLKLMHLNTQSMLSTFNEFALTVNKYPLDVITLSETWMKSNKDRLEYVSLPGFSKEFRNRDNVKGGGVGAYIRDNIKYKRRKDIENTQADIEHLWLEIQGKNKPSKLLLGNFYRSEAMHRPSAWLDKFEDLNGCIIAQWDGLLVLTGDMNFDLLGIPDAPRWRYISLLDTLNVKQIIDKRTRTTRSSRTLLDHIIINDPSKITSHGVNRAVLNAPLRRCCVTRPPAPGMDNETIHNLQSQRDKLRREAHQSNSESSWSAFRQLRNKMKSAIHKARKAFMEKALPSNKSKEVWRMVHRVLHPCQQSLRFDPDKLNLHFATARRTLDVESTNQDELFQFIRGLTDKEGAFHLESATQREGPLTLKQLRTDCSTGPDQLPARFVKLVARYLASSLTTIINNRISKLYFPHAWKLARISPIPNVDTPVSEDHLRPVSILPVLCKVFEKLVASQMTDFCTRESLLKDTISSFRKGHSTSTVLLGIRDDLFSAMKRKEVTLMVLADFSKAVDTFCFKTVITKLHHLGFSKYVLEWLANYLCGRRHYVQIGDRKSSPVLSEFGIPQGSSLGPMLFNLYVADLQDILPPTIKSFQYADDTTLAVLHY
ncbi:putative RNA-directed DNA polymerase from transposon BS [Stylophora pistillata]|uniref:Putative RNA-directed DNA polymerase from transposon BS n=1 Tax=Stylophora pistillata TaxID=50429 RepID=A0A2B4RWP2_STYPI|nr:putative RNA-directed DNA polymerase from transposon BS [Stylophora pistillata]